MEEFASTLPFLPIFKGLFAEGLFPHET